MFVEPKISQSHWHESATGTYTEASQSTSLPRYLLPQIHLTLSSYLRLDFQSGIFLYVFRLPICAFVKRPRRSVRPYLFENVTPITEDEFCFCMLLKYMGKWK